MLAINSDISRISERCVEIVNIAAAQPSGKMEFSEEGKEEVETLFSIITPAVENALTALVEQDVGLAETVVTDITKYHKAIKRSNKNHMKRWKKREDEESLRMAYPAVLTEMQRIGYNCLSLAEETLEEREFGFTINISEGKN